MRSHGLQGENLKDISDLVSHQDVNVVKADVLPLCSDLLCSLTTPVQSNDSGTLAVLFDEHDTYSESIQDRKRNLPVTDASLLALIQSELPSISLAESRKLLGAAKSILGANSSKESENLLMELFDYSHPRLVSELMRTSSVTEEGILAVGSMAPTLLINLDHYAEEIDEKTSGEVKFSALDQEVFETQHEGYDEIKVNPKRLSASSQPALVDITELPSWCRCVFAGFASLNLIQSHVYPVVFGEFSENVLMCAPTGAGKTNVAVLSLLSLFSQYVNNEGAVRRGGFKAVYIAPMKALVHEVVQSLRIRLKPLGLVVNELSGDASLSRHEMEETDVIITTPEKWDVVTRKRMDSRLQLLIIDEVHLLNDSRGVVIEALVARFLRRQDKTGQHIRIVGLSATLPNYEEVATFLRVSKRGLFFFGPEYRPVPLRQTYIGITSAKSAKRSELMMKALMQKLTDELGRNQVIVFVHSRNDAVRTAVSIRDSLVHQGLLSSLLPSDSASVQILKDEGKSFKSPFLSDLVTYSIGVHHAGMPKEDRTGIEELFADRHLQILVSTLTLAWGVNLPAHTVIIKGTRIYSPDKGDWIDLSGLDMLQMVGRAGRPQYDTEGHGIVITERESLPYYLSLNNTQLDVESRLAKKIPELINAEIQAGSIISRSSALEWLGYTFFSLRLSRKPGKYGVHYHADTPEALQFRINLIHSALHDLDKNGLIQYDIRSGNVTGTHLGRIASHYYIRGDTLAAFSRMLKPNMSDTDILVVLASSIEFRQMTVREEERNELARLAEVVPFPTKSSEDISMKVSILVQCLVSREKLEGQVLSSDLTYIQTNGPRILRAMFMIALNRGWSTVSRKVLGWAKSVENQMWWVQSPLWQLEKNLPVEVLHRLEKKSLPWADVLTLDPTVLADILRISQKSGKQLYKSVHSLPFVSMSASVQPLSSHLFQLNLLMESSEYVLGSDYWIFVEDVAQSRAIFVEKVSLQGLFTETISVVLPLTLPEPPHYFVRAVSDRFIIPEFTSPISFRSLSFPAKLTRPMQISDLSKSDIIKGVGATFGLSNLSDEQLSLIPRLITNSCLLSGPPSSGKFYCALIGGIISAQKMNCKLVIVCSSEKSLVRRMTSLNSSLRGSQYRAAKGLNFSDASHIYCCSSSGLERAIRLGAKVSGQIVVCDDLHDIAFDDIQGHVYELLMTKLLDLGNKIFGLTSWGANVSDLANWLHIPNQNVFQFAPGISCEYEITTPEDFTPDSESYIIEIVRHVSANIRCGPVIVVSNQVKRYEQIVNAVLSSNVDLQKQNTAVFGVNSTQEAIARMHDLLKSGELKLLLLPPVSACLLDFEARIWVVHDPGMATAMSDLTSIIRLACQRDYQRSSKVIYVTARRNVGKVSSLLKDSGFIESNLDKHIRSSLAFEVCNGNLSNKQELVDWISATFFFARLQNNPNFYGLGDCTETSLSRFVSSIVEESVSNMVRLGLCCCDDDFTLVPTRLASTLSFAVDLQDFEIMARESHAGLRRKAILEVLVRLPSLAARLRPIESSLPVGLQVLDYLIGMFDNRQVLPLFQDYLFSLVDCCEALSDVQRVRGYRKSAMACMELCAFMTSRVPPGQSGLLQIPTFDMQLVERAESLGVMDVPDLINLSPESRGQLFENIEPSRLSLIADFCNIFPYISMDVCLVSSNKIRILLRRDSNQTQSVETEKWWVMVSSEDIILDSAKITLSKPETELILSVMGSKTQSVAVVLMSGSYVGADQEEIVVLNL